MGLVQEGVAHLNLPLPGTPALDSLGESSSSGRPAPPLPRVLTSPRLRRDDLLGSLAAALCRGRHVGRGGGRLYPVRCAGVAKLATAPGLGPGGAQAPWGFKSLRPHWEAAAHGGAATMPPCPHASRSCRRTKSA